MGLLEKVKKSLAKREEEREEENKEDDNEKIDSFLWFDKKWVLSPFMKEISEGELERIPIECMLTHYLLKNGIDCYYISLMDNEGGDEYGVWQFDWLGEEMEGEERFEVEFREVSLGMGAVDCARFLSERLEIGYDIYIEERVELET